MSCYIGAVVMNSASSRLSHRAAREQLVFAVP